MVEWTAFLISGKQVFLGEGLKNQWCDNNEFVVLTYSKPFEILTNAFKRILRRNVRLFKVDQLDNIEWAAH